jgi:phage/plasmid primase-like uncharacterized protein
METKKKSWRKNMADLTPFAAHIEAARAALKSQDISDDPRSDFYSALTGAGYKPDGQIILGRVVRIADPVDKPHKKTGWYFYNEIEFSGYILGIGSWGSWRDGEKVTWSSKAQSALSFEEGVKYREELERARLAREIEQSKIHDEAAAGAAELYNSISQAPNNHPYLARKGIKAPDGVRLDGDRLIIPILNEGMRIISTQSIGPDGFKKNRTGGKMKGGFFPISGSPDRVCICEGMATGASISEATGATVFCAMSASNIYEVTGAAKRKYQNAEIVICADDNSANKINTGLNAALQAAEAFGCRVVSPATPKDFNDQHAALGLESVRTTIFPKNKKYEPQPEVLSEKQSLIVPTSGFLRDVYDYYNATSGNDQKGFAVQTAIALASVILGRRFQTDNGNFTSLYLLNIGKSSTGKEHSKTVIHKILKAANQVHLMGGSGYTSEGAVVSATLDKPKHISICDEFGRNLQAARNSGDANFAGANSKLMEAIGACHSILRPKNYSTMGVAKDKAGELRRAIENPAITILAMSTPSTFFESIDHKAIMDGFIGRFIIHVSDAKREIRRRVQSIDVPESILSWIATAMERSKSDVQPDVATEEPPCETLQITQEAWEAYTEAATYFINQANALEELKMDDVNNRAHEFVLRLALISALSRDINSKTVEVDDVRWSFDYIRSAMDRVLMEFKQSVSGSEFEGKKKDALITLRRYATKGLSLKDMNKRQPFAKWTPKERKEVLDALEEAELIFREAIQTTGRTATIYYARGD